jgi:uncharacterized protein
MKILRLLLIAPCFTFAALAADSSTPAAAPTPPAPEKIAPPAVVQADPAAVEAVLKAVHFDEMMGKALDQQKQMVQQMVMRSRIPATTKEELMAFQQKAMDVAFAGLNIEEIHAVAARNYGETFTTDELHGIADFFNSPAGQAYAAKRPQAEQKIGATLRPRVMEAMQKIQQMNRDFVAQQQAKAQADAAKAAAAKAKDQKASGAPAAPTTSATPAPAAPPKS